jgi:membrane-associated phospholipid phosphatase
MTGWTHLLQADHALFFFLNGMAAFKPLGAGAEALSDFGRYAVILLAGIFLALEGLPAFRRHTLALLLIAPLALGLNIGLKHAVNRARPLGHYREAIAHGSVTLVSLETTTRRSFPSGHSMLTFFILGYLALAQRRHTGWALALALAVAWSRVAVGAHYPSDCLVGSAFGLAWAWSAWRFKTYLDGDPGRAVFRLQEKTSLAPSG